MGKRSRFQRRRQDYYPTPLDAVMPLAAHVPQGVRFAEPCAGDGRLIDHLRRSCGAVCGFAGDVMPRRGDVVWQDALALTADQVAHCDVIITNPPWSRPVLHALIAHLASLRPTWLLFDADWPHTKQSRALMAGCHEIAPVGRVRWIPGSKHTGKDNCAWYRFGDTAAATVFHPRAA